MKNKIYIILIAILGSILLIQTAYVISLERNQKIFMAKQRLRRMMPSFRVNFIMQKLPNEYLITMYLPGFKKEEISLELKDRYLTVSGGKKIKKVVTLPENIQKKEIVWEYKGSKLTIHIPRKLSSKKVKLK